MSIRRSREGSVFQRHDHPSCPPPTIDDDGRKTWPEHRCRGRWVAVVDLGTVAGKRRRRTAYAATEREAKAERRRLLRELDAGRLGDDCTVSQWLTHWLDEIAPETMTPRTLSNHRGHVDLWLIPELGTLRLTDVRPDDVRRLRARLAGAESKRGGGKTISTTTARAIQATLTAALEQAVTERRIVWNPAKAVAKPALSGSHHDHWTDPKHARAMIDSAVDLEEQARFAVALYAGLRQGEALGLRWADVDLDARVIHVRATAKRVKGLGMVVTSGAKTAYSVRDVPMHALVHSLLTDLSHAARGPLVFGGNAPRSDSTDYRAWIAGCARAGVPEIPLHGARATCATLLRAQGVAASTVGEILGHKPGSGVTELAYAHAQPAELEAAIKLL